MSKYPEFDPTYTVAPSQYERVKIKTLTNIANELAEQNRIARAEMDFKIMMAVDPALVATFSFVNEDLA